MDSADEYVRLTALYAQKTDGELMRLMEDPDSLTEVAEEALRSEFQRRGLELLAVEEELEPTEIEYQKLVTIRKYMDLPDALLAQGCLEASGIDSYLVDDNMVRIDWFISNILGGVKLNVRPEDAQLALEVLDQDSSTDTD